MFEPVESDEITQPHSIWDRIGNLFAFDPADLDGEAEYDDLSGSQWGGGSTGGAQGENGELLEWEDELAETIIIVGVVALIMALVWLRGFISQMMRSQLAEAEERRRANEAAAAGGHGDMAAVAAQAERAQEVRLEQHRRLEELERRRRELEEGGGQVG